MPYRKFILISSVGYKIMRVISKMKIDLLVSVKVDYNIFNAKIIRERSPNFQRGQKESPR